MGDAQATLVGTFTLGKRSNSYLEPDDPHEFELENIFVGDQDLYEFLSHCNKEFIDGSTMDVVEWLINREWDKIVEAGIEA